MFALVYNNKYYYVTDRDTMQPTGSFIPLTTYPTLEEAEKATKIMAKWHFYQVTVKNVNTGEEIPYLNGVRAKKKSKPTPKTTAQAVTSFDDIIVGF